MRCLGIVLLAAAARPARAWVLYATSEDDTLIYRWDSPAESTSNGGLGGGLTWAVQDSFCDKILPRFYAEQFGDLVDCEAIVDAIVRGFRTWSANHPRINFHDLTDECQHRPSLFVPDATSATAAQIEAAAAAECGGLEISITAGAPLLANHSQLAAVVYNMPRDRAKWVTGTRSTAGDVSGATRAIELSRMHFNTELCWRWRFVHSL